MTDGPISKIAGYGIRVDLSEYDVRRSRDGGVPLWTEQIRKYVRNSAGQLDRYLADVRDFSESDKFVVFKHEVTERGQPPTECASQSYPADLSKIPSSEVSGLQAALASFKSQATDDLKQNDLDRWQIISNLRLPNPGVDPQFYRIYGPLYRRRLLVLWGLERRPNYAGNLPTSLTPEDTISLLRDQQVSRPPWLWWLIPLLLLLLFLLMLLWGYLAGLSCSWLGIGCSPPPIGQAEPLKLEKTASAGDITPDGTVRYNFTISNLSQYQISDVEVVDAKVPDLLCRFSLLDAHSQQICQGIYHLNAADLAARKVVNTATANGFTKDKKIIKAEDTLSLNLSDADIQRISKCCAASVLPNTGGSGQPITNGNPSGGNNGLAPTSVPPTNGGQLNPLQSLPGSNPNQSTQPDNLGLGSDANNSGLTPTPGNVPHDGTLPPQSLPGSNPNQSTQPDNLGLGSDANNSGLTPTPGNVPRGGTQPPAMLPMPLGQTPTGLAPTEAPPSSRSPSENVTGNQSPVTPDTSTNALPVSRTDYSATITNQALSGNGLLDLTISATGNTDGHSTAVSTAEWLIDGGDGRRIEISGNPVRVSLPASKTPYQLTLRNPNKQKIQKSFDLPIRFEPAQLISK
jgi:hypothetical protein